MKIVLCIFGLVLQGLTFFGSAFGDSPFQIELRGDVQKLADPQNSILRLSIRGSVEGAHNFILTRKQLEAGYYSQNAKRINYRVTNSKFFHGTIRGRGPNAGSQRNVSASIRNKTLRINFYGRRGKHFTATVPIPSNLDEVQALSGRIRHVPRHHVHGIECEIDHQHSSTTHDSPTHRISLKFATSEAKELKVVKVGLDADYEYFQRYGEDLEATIARMKEVFNEVQAIYLRQLGVQLKISGINVFTKPDQPYTSKSHEKLYKQFKEYTNRTKHLGSHHVAHLFSGKDMAVRGFAFVATVCRNPSGSYGFSRTFKDSFFEEALDPRVVAHELGHNFGAKHDFNTESIMSPVVVVDLSKDVDLSRFSIGEINDHLARHGSCLSSTQKEKEQPSPEQLPPSQPEVLIKASKRQGTLTFSAKIITGTNPAKLYYTGKKRLVRATPDTSRLLLVKTIQADSETVTLDTQVETETLSKRQRRRGRRKARGFFIVEFTGESTRFSEPIRVKVSELEAFRISKSLGN